MSRPRQYPREADKVLIVQEAERASGPISRTQLGWNPATSRPQRAVTPTTLSPPLKSGTKQNKVWKTTQLINTKHLPTYLMTYSMQQSPSLESNRVLS